MGIVITPHPDNLQMGSLFDRSYVAEIFNAIFQILKRAIANSENLLTFFFPLKVQEDGLNTLKLPCCSCQCRIGCVQELLISPATNMSSDLEESGQYLWEQFNPI